MYPAATIPNTQVRIITATRSGQVYRISIALPSSYNETRARYPVLYLLDANWYFGMVTETARLLRVLGPELPAVIFPATAAVFLIRRRGEIIMTWSWEKLLISFVKSPYSIALCLKGNWEAIGL